jgi:hypothetical protein
MKSSYPFFYAVLFLLLPVATWAVEAPALQTGSWWQYSETMVITSPDMGGEPLTMTTAPRYNLNYKGPRTQVKTGQVYESYVMEFSSTFNLSGSVDTGVIGVRPVRVRNGSYTGSVWLEQGTLSLIHRERRLAGMLEVNVQIFGWQDAGPLTLNVTEEYAPALNEYDFPLNDGDTWQQSTVLYTFGDYDAPYVGGDVIDGNTTTLIVFNASGPVNNNGHTAYHVEENLSVGGTINNYFAPAVRWYSSMTMSNVALGDSFTINSLNYVLTDYSLAPDPPTATPTSTPTPTPIPTDTPTLTPTPTFTSTPTSTPTPIPPTDTPIPTDTPVPTDTPIPTETPTPTPDHPFVEGPFITYGGYLGSVISHGQGGMLSIFAATEDPTGAEVERVELWVAGMPVGLDLPQIAPGIFGLFSLPVPPGMPLGRQLFGLTAHNDQGQESDLWPFLTCHGYEQHWMPEDGWRQLYRRTTGGFDPANSPRILAGGFGETRLTAWDGGVWQILAFTYDPQGVGTIDRVELHWGGQFTGLTLVDDGLHGDLGRGNGVYGQTLSIAPEDVPYGGSLLLFEMVAVDQDGNVSPAWPYLTTHQ